MPISQSDQIFSLVKSLTKAEKRNFRIYTSRFQDGNSSKYIQLFDILDKQKELDERELFKLFPKAQLSNLKRHLYKQILISLRLIHISKSAHIEIRELMDFANILYRKGLYLQSLKILDKAKAQAQKIHNDLILLNIYEFEKIIESRHITRSGPEKINDLLSQSEKQLKGVSNLVKLTNLKIYLHGLYIQNGHIKSKEEHDQVDEIFEKHISTIDITTLNPIEKVHMFQSFVWYYYILIDFVNCYSYASKWVNILLESKIPVHRDPNLLMRGYHYILTSAYNILDVDNYLRHLEELERFRKKNYKKFDLNTQIVSFLYVHNGRLNKYFLQGEFEEGTKTIPSTLRRINRYQDKLDAHRIMVLYFKIAWMYFGAEKYNMCLKYLNKIITLEIGKLREDVQGYTRLMHLMAHYESENYDIGDYLVKNVERFFSKMEDSNLLQIMTLKFFKKINKIPVADREEAFIIFEKELTLIYHNKYESKAFLYLDILSWVRSKNQKKSLSFITKQKLKSNYA